MTQSPLRLIKGKIELIAQSEINQLPKDIRGIHALFEGHPEKKVYNVRYVGMSTRSIRTRLKKHRKKRRHYGHTARYLRFGTMSETMRSKNSKAFCATFTDMIRLLIS